MHLHIHFPDKDIYVCTVVLSTGDIFWKVSDILKLHNYTKTGNALVRYLPEEKFQRYSDITSHNSLNTFMGTTGQILRLISKVKKSRESVKEWFYNIIDGTQELYALNSKDFNEALNPSNKTCKKVIFTKLGDYSYSFTLPWLQQHFKNLYSEAHPPIIINCETSMNVEMSSDNDVSDTPLVIDEDVNKENEPVHEIPSNLDDIDFSTFVYTDNLGKKYKFGKAFLNWKINETRTANVGPIYRAEGDQVYLYYPIKIDE